MNINMRKTQSGFTLIELVIVIVILGILAAIALPRYLDLESEAISASCDGVEGAILSTAAITIAEHRTTPTAAQIDANLSVAGGVTVDLSSCTAEFGVNGEADNCGTVDLAALGLCTT